MFVTNTKLLLIKDRQEFCMSAYEQPSCMRELYKINKAGRELVLLPSESDELVLILSKR